MDLLQLYNKLRILQGLLEEEYGDPADISLSPNKDGFVIRAHVAGLAARQIISQDKLAQLQNTEPSIDYYITKIREEIKRQKPNE